jgi:hypothetical protein
LTPLSPPTSLLPQTLAPLLALAPSLAPCPLHSALRLVHCHCIWYVATASHIALALYTLSPLLTCSLRALYTLTVSCTSSPSLMRPHYHLCALIRRPHRFTISSCAHPTPPFMCYFHPFPSDTFNSPNGHPQYCSCHLITCSTRPLNNEGMTTMV